MATQNFSPIGPAVWPAIGNIDIHKCLVLLSFNVFISFYDNTANEGAILFELLIA